MYKRDVVLELNCSDYGKKLKELRELRGLTPIELACELGSSVVTINAIERCVLFPQGRLLVEIGKFYGIDINYSVFA